MSSRRKRAPPLRVDEEAKKRLDWNMLDDRKNEVIQEDDDQTPTCSFLAAEPTPSSTEAVAGSALTVTFSEEVPSSEGAAASSSLALDVVPFLKLGHMWKALIGEFRVRPAWLPSDWDQTALTLHRVGEQLCLSYSRCEESSAEWRPEEDVCTAECSLSRVLLDDLDWLQKRRVLQLCHQAKEESVKV